MKNFQRNKKIFFLLLLICCIAAFMLNSCAGKKRFTDFELQRQIWGERDSSDMPVYITDTKPIDSVDVFKLIYDIFRIETDQYPDNLKIYSRVYDSLGHFVTNMADPYRKDSSITYFTAIKEELGKIYNPREVPIEHFTVREFGANDSIPYNIVLNIDYSGSMTAVANAIFDGAELFISLKFPYDRIAVASFNRDFDIKVPLIQDKEQILSLYRAKKGQGFGLFSAVYDAVWNSMELFEDTDTTTPRVLVIFTDGDENYSRREIGEIIKKAKDEKIHIFAVAFGYSKDDYLKQLAFHTGGKFYKAYTKEELVSIFRDIYMSLRFYYLIQYKPPKFWGRHFVNASLNVPEREDTLFAYGEYNTSDMWRDVGDEFTMPILFDYNKWDLKPENIPIIEEIVDEMMARPRLKLEIQGHTDNIGGAEFNQKLSDRRAETVMYAILERGIHPNRLRSRGFGLTMPVASNATEEGRTKNRRTQFVILAK